MAGENQEKEFVYTSQMSCEHCVAAIKKALFKVRKVKSYQANPETDLIKIVFADKQEPLSETEIKTILSESDYMLVLKK